MDSYIQITQRAMMFCIWIAGRQLRCRVAADCTAFAKGMRYADDNTDHPDYYTNLGNQLKTSSNLKLPAGPSNALDLVSYQSYYLVGCRDRPCSTP
jgi:hypothetical protein